MCKFDLFHSDSEADLRQCSGKKETKTINISMRCLLNDSQNYIYIYKKNNPQKFSLCQRFPQTSSPFQLEGWVEISAGNSFNMSVHPSDLINCSKCSFCQRCCCVFLLCFVLVLERPEWVIRKNDAKCHNVT